MKESDWRRETMTDLEAEIERLREALLKIDYCGRGLKNLAANPRIAREALKKEKRDEQ